ncbi:hypothetical protein JAO73_15615 [Hymenobacter sp. BT523]|nr:hypothetical protein [Hymenobacter sp. BT523]
MEAYYNQFLALALGQFVGLLYLYLIPNIFQRFGQLLRAILQAGVGGFGQEDGAGLRSCLAGCRDAILRVSALAPGGVCLDAAGQP